MSKEMMAVASKWLNKQNLAAWNKAKDAEGLAAFGERVAREAAEIADTYRNDSREAILRHFGLKEDANV